MRGAIRRTSPLLVLGLAVVAMATAAAASLLFLSVRALTQPAILLDSRIPNEQYLIDQRLSGVPSANQSTHPIAVDRVLADGAATYVQYQVTGPPDPTIDVPPILADDRGHAVNYGVSDEISPARWDHLLPSWFPWHPLLVRRSYAILGPLPIGAHAAVLQFGNGEVVRVALAADARARQPVSHPGTVLTLNQLQGLQVRVDDVGMSYLALGYTPFAVTRGVVLLSRGGHAVPLTRVGGECGGDSFRGSMSCRAAWAFPPQQHRTRLTLTIPAFEFTSAPGAGMVVHGPWRIPFVTP